MAKLEIYGVPQSRAFRTIWMAEELELDYELLSTQFGTDTDSPAYKKINPNGRIPAIDDGGFVVWESMAINLYLAKKHPGPLTPENLEEETLATQWSFWAMTEIEKPLLAALFARIGMMGVEKDEATAQQHFAELGRPLGVLNQHLDGRDYLVADRFTVADLNVASVLSWAQVGRFDLGDWPLVNDWLSGATSRAAAARARG